MLAFLKPTKAKLVGLVLLMIADWFCGFVSSKIGGLLIPQQMIDAVTPAFKSIFAGPNFMQLLFVGLVIEALGFVLKLILFYAIVAFTVDYAVGNEKKKAQDSAK